MVAAALVSMSWQLGEFWRQHGTTELYEAVAGDPFASAIKIWEGRGTRVIIPKDDTVKRSYWVRMATIGGQVSGTEPASVGLVAGAQPADVTILDSEFELATDQTYWYWGAATGVALSLTGGVAGGVASLTGDSSIKFLNARGTTNPYRVITGQQFKIYLRWRRRTSITSASGADEILRADLNAVSGVAPWSSGQASTAGISLSRTTINAATVDEWQQTSVTTTIQNVAASLAQLPYLGAFLTMNAAATGGVIEIDAFNAIPI
jgi:hypothetical protein